MLQNMINFITPYPGQPVGPVAGLPREALGIGEPVKKVSFRSLQTTAEGLLICLCRLGLAGFVDMVSCYGRVKWITVFTLLFPTHLNVKRMQTHRPGLMTSEIMAMAPLCHHHKTDWGLAFIVVNTFRH